MSKICTSIEQSKILIELGIDVKTADMHYFDDHYNLETLEADFLYSTYLSYLYDKFDYIPAWSLNSLLNIIKNRKDCNGVELRINYVYNWTLTTTTYDSVWWKEKEIIAETPIDAAFEMICWLKENGRL